MDYVDSVVASLTQWLESPETKAMLQKTMDETAAKYQPLHDWYATNQEKPKNLYEAVIQRETFKEACTMVFGKEVKNGTWQCLCDW